ncbi:MAG: bifunctional proline dehydrogenase/L-glutamate gamma-semialdehyde dehydrogenase PutA [Pseudomonadales bacterium]
MQELGELRGAIKRYHRSSEEEVLKRLMPLAQSDAEAIERIQSRALSLSRQVREIASGESGVQALLNEYDLSSEEGIVLMCLAEALLRVPDNDTADKLIQDKILKGDWAANLESQDSFFVHASAWGLLLTGKVVGFNRSESNRSLLGLGKVVGRLGEPVIRVAMRQAMRIMGTQFVLGQTIAEACANAAPQEQRGYRYSYDMLGEASRTQAAADEYLQSYEDAINEIGRLSENRDHLDGPGISIKLSALHPRYDYANRERVYAELFPRLKQLVLLAKSYDIGVSIDAEEADRLELSLDLIERMYTDPELGDWGGFGVVVQAYQKRALDLVQWLVALARQEKRQLMVRLVKGAYWDAEIKHAQLEGLSGYPVFTRKATTDISYRACARVLLENRDVVYPQFATHNANSVSAILEIAGDHEAYEFQRLHGMGDELYDSLMADIKIPCRIYAPVGEHEDLLAYLVRRLLENGANTSFVNKIVDDSVPLETLVADPVAKATAWSQAHNPGIVLPADIYGAERRNSAGIDLSDESQHLELHDAIESWTAAAVEGAGKHLSVSREHAVHNPAKTSECLGYIALAEQEDCEHALVRSESARSDWSATSAEDRAKILCRFADALQAQEHKFIALCVKEAGKTINDGVGEVREAIDFCRYYAAQAKGLETRHPQLEALGTVLCISPWNFPLAIFLGQVTAALATGNCVIAKPAEQTSLVALSAARLLSECGLPEHVLQVVCARGVVAGDHLVPDARINAVMFTGSTATAQLIARRLADRPGPRVALVAETGGQNCMIADSTALTEQLVDDVISSGFQSAGQRCSALRVLYVQDDAAGKTIDMIAGAMQQLGIGDPSDLTTDVGPVIDQRALHALHSHVDYMDGLCAGGKARLVYECELGEQCSQGSFFAPRLYEIDSIDLLRGEVFGPVVHVVRYRSNEFDKVLEAVNSTGFGLTFGVHSRIDANCDKAARRVDAGNVYVNRNTIGAVVGVQPFGGHGLSGTGPKAGGPSYLYRLLRHKSTDSAVLLNSSLPQVFSHTAGTTHVSKELQIQKNDLLKRQSLWAAKPMAARWDIVQQALRDCDVSDAEWSRLSALVQYALLELDEPLEMKGPTGEQNLLSHIPRGLLCALSAGTGDELLPSVCMALVLGNVVLASVSAGAQPRPADLALQSISDKCYVVCELNNAADLAGFVALPAMNGLLSNVTGEQLSDLERQLRRRDGALLALINEPLGEPLLRRLVLEKHVSTDTTASGGNASLLALGEDSD